MNNRLLSMLGLSRKAGKLKCGEFSVEESIKSGKACLVVIAGDASGNTKKRFHDMCEYYEVPLIEYSTRTELAKAVGKELTASAAVCDEGFAESMIKLFKQLENNSED